jgi:CheY-like chemotaxis protein
MYADVRALPLHASPYIPLKSAGCCSAARNVLEERHRARYARGVARPRLQCPQVAVPFCRPTAAMNRDLPSKAYRPTLLLIDDATDLLVAWAALLEFEGFHLATAAGGLEGLSQARTLRPSLVITDLMMPGLSGADVCRIMKSDPALQKIPVILWTASSEIPAGLQCERVLRKPVARPLLVRHIHALLGDAADGADADGATDTRDEKPVHAWHG